MIPKLDLEASSEVRTPGYSQTGRNSRALHRILQMLDIVSCCVPGVWAPHSKDRGSAQLTWLLFVFCVNFSVSDGYRFATLRSNPGIFWQRLTNLNEGFVSHCQEA